MRLNVFILCLAILLWNPVQARAEDWRKDLPFNLHGFVEGGFGVRTQNDPNQHHDVNYAELRLQLEASKTLESAEFKLRLDLFRDEALHKFSADLREAHASFTPSDSVDLKIGRQVLTWGTGDLFFLNDLFPKDFQGSFQLGQVQFLF